MSSFRFCIIVALCVLGLSDARGANSYNEALQLQGRSLQQDTFATVTRVRMVDFSTLTAANDEILAENELSGRINVTVSDEPVMYGAFYLGPSEVERIDTVVSAELEVVPAAEATLAPVVQFPGRQLKGRSVLDSLNERQPRRIPSIFAPFYSGYKFKLEGRKSPPGTTLHFSNMTLLIANATYVDLATSGLMDYFDLGDSARICMTNSMFALESCKGFVPMFHMWCCTKRQCNIQYTKQAIEDLGYPMPTDLELITCHQLTPSESKDQSEKEDGGLGTVAIIAICMAGGLAICVMCILCQAKRRSSAARAAAAADAGKATDGCRLHPALQECESTASESTADTCSPPPYFQQHTDPPAQSQVTSSAFQPPLQTTLQLGTSMPTANNNSNDSIQAHASTAQFSADSSSHPRPAATTGNGTAMRGNVAAPSGVGYRVPPPSPLRPGNLRPLPGPPRSGAYIAQQLASSAASSAGAVGQAADPTISTCALFGVATEDTVTSYDTASAATLIAPGAEASRQEWKEHLERQLDSVLGRLVRGTLRVLPGHHNRLQGGQAVVQIVEDTSTSLQYAIKFFLSTGAFQQEKSLYSDPAQPLGRFLPQLHAHDAIIEGEQAALRDAHGSPLPPCIIMEKGEALDVWIDNSGDKIDLFTGLQVLSHIADRLIDLHAAGYVHRDIKPGNIMWLPRTKRWTLIDFGCAAATGSFARIGFSLYYGAPEALRAYMGGEGGVQAAEALDAWSLGVMAIELLTGKPALDPFRNKEQTIEMILGNVPAPWEDHTTSRAMLRPLGIFKVGVLRLLERDPSKRSTIHQFQQACRRSLSNSTVTA